MDETTRKKDTGRLHVQVSAAAELLWEIPLGRRPAAVTMALACLPSESLEVSFAMGPLRAALAAVWEEVSGLPVPIEFLRRRLTGSVDVHVWVRAGGLVMAQSKQKVVNRVTELIEFLVRSYERDAGKGG